MQDDVEIARTWTELFKRRPLVFFKFRISLSAWGVSGNQRAREFLLSLKVLGLSVVSSIKHLVLGSNVLEDAMLHGLAHAFETLNFVHLESLDLPLSDSVNEEGSFITMGRVLGTEHLPSLKSLRIKVEKHEQNDLSRVSSWAALFGAVPVVNGLSKLETFTVDSGGFGTVSKVFQALANLQGRPPVMGNVKTICITNRINATELEHVCAALSPAILPRLKTVYLKGK